MKYLTTLCYILTIISYFALRPDYEHQSDYRLRQFYPAAVVDMYQQNVCNADSCWTVNELNLQLADYSIVTNVRVSESLYNSTNLGDYVELERHVTDPLIVKQNTTRSVICTLLLILSILFTAGWLTYRDDYTLYRKFPSPPDIPIQFRTNRPNAPKPRKIKF